MWLPPEKQRFSQTALPRILPGIEDPGDDGGVDLRGIAFEDAGAVHHRYARHADVVLDRDGLAREHAGGGAFDLAPPVPGAEGVVLWLRPTPRAAAVFHRWGRRGQLVDPGVRGEHTCHQPAEGLEIVHGEVQVVPVRDVIQLVKRGPFRGHPCSSSCMPCARPFSSCAGQSTLDWATHRMRDPQSDSRSAPLSQGGLGTAISPRGGALAPSWRDRWVRCPQATARDSSDSRCEAMLVIASGPGRMKGPLRVESQGGWSVTYLSGSRGSWT